MLTLVVAHRDETVTELSSQLERRDISVEHVSVIGRVTPIDAPGVDPGDYDVGFVFPGRTMEGGVLDAILSVPWVNDRETVLRSRNKAETLARLERAGLPIPETVLVSNPTEMDAVANALDGLDLPVVLKPNSATRGTGVLKVHDRDSLRGAIDYLDLVHEFSATGDRSFLLQEFLPDARDFRVMVVDGEYAGAVERVLPSAERESGRWKQNVHRGATAKSVLPAPQIRDLACRAAEVMEIPFVGVDVLSTGERTVVAETNARPTIDDPAKYVDSFVSDLASLVRKTADRSG